MLAMLSGYEVKIVYANIPYTIHLKEGVNIPCVVTVLDDEWRVFAKGKYYEVDHVICDLAIQAQ